MGSTSTHRVGGGERARFTVAELLGRYADQAGDGGVTPDEGCADGPPGHLGDGGPLRRRLVAVAGTLAVAGTFAAGAVLGTQPISGGGPLGTETAGAGHPIETPRAARPRAALAEPPRPAVTRTARVVPIGPGARTPVRRPAPKPVPRRAPDTRGEPQDRRIADHSAVRAPAGSALSSLTPPIGPVDALDSLLGGIGR